MFYRLLVDCLVLYPLFLYIYPAVSAWINKLALTCKSNITTVLSRKLSYSSQNSILEDEVKPNFNFYDFYLRYKTIFGDSKIAPSSEFLSWFIGFSEGDGSFIVNKRAPEAAAAADGGCCADDLSFVIVQDTRDVQVLNMIKKVLGFGKVIKQGKTTSRFIVQDKAGFYLLCVLFNGNIVTRSKLESFKAFLLAFNSYSSKGRLRFETINFKPLLAQASLNNG